MNGTRQQNECFIHGGERREPWGSSLRDIEVIRCDHLGSAYVVEMYLVAGGEERQYRSHHIHFVRDSVREVHALDEYLSQDQVEQVWAAAVAAMERGDRPRNHEAQYHAQRVSPLSA